MIFEWDSGKGVFKYKDNPHAEKILKIYDRIKKETLKNYGIDKLREIMNAFLSATSNYQSKANYSSNTLKFLSGLNAAEERLGMPEDKRTTLEGLDDLIKNFKTNQ